MKKKGKYQNAIVAKLLLCALLCPCILGACGGGGTAADPVGTVYIGCATPYGCDVRRFQFKGNREKVRQWACVNALSMALSTIRSQIKRR